MSKHLQQHNQGSATADRKIAAAMHSGLLKANKAIALLLVLIIIPTLSGVALIA